jgi:hypothetical protein
LPAVLCVLLACGKPAPRRSQQTSTTPQAATATPAPTVAAVDDPDIRKFADDDLLKALLLIKQKDGRDNAMIHYQVANLMLGDDATKIPPDWIKYVLENGWSQQAAVLLPYLARLHPMFVRIRKGVALDYARNVGWELGVEAPVPNFLAGQILAKMFCVGGAYFESQGKYREALTEYYLPALTMGRDYGKPAGTLIGGLISVAVQSIALDSIHALISSGKLDRPTLMNLLAYLQKTEATQGSFIDLYRGESQITKQLIGMMRTNPKEALKWLSMEAEQKIDPADAARQIDRIQRESDKFWKYLIQYSEMPYWQRDPAKFKQDVDQMKASFHPATAVAVPNFTEADVRLFVMIAKLRQTQLAAALAAFKKEKGAYPQQLSELAPGFFETLPVDPFSGQSLIYRPSPNRAVYVLYSVGPDRRDN